VVSERVVCTHHALHEIERTHANRHVRIVDAAEDGVVVGSDEMRVGGEDLDESDEGDVAYCKWSKLADCSSGDIRRLTVLIDVLEEALELVDAGGRESLSVASVEHASNDGSLDALVEERHGGSRLDELGQWWNELANEPRLLGREDGEL